MEAFVSSVPVRAVAEGRALRGELVRERAAVCDTTIPGSSQNRGGSLFEWSASSFFSQKSIKRFARSNSGKFATSRAAFEVVTATASPPLVDAAASDQWQRYLNNLGEWSGTARRFDMFGALQSEDPSFIAVEQGADGEIKQLIRIGTNPEINRTVTPAAFAGKVLFFEGGNYSGGGDFKPLTQFGVEAGLIDGDRRLRLQHVFNGEGELARVVVTREVRNGASADEGPTPTIEDFVGQWKGEGVTMYTDGRSPTTSKSSTKVELTPEGYMETGLDLKPNTLNPSPASQSLITFIAGDFGSDVFHVLLFPDGAYLRLPVQQIGHFQLTIPPLEAGWFLSPTKRMRLVRTHDTQGRWSSVTLFQETKVSA